MRCPLSAVWAFRDKLENTGKTQVSGEPTGRMGHDAIVLVLISLKFPKSVYVPRQVKSTNLKVGREMENGGQAETISKYSQAVAETMKQNEKKTRDESPSVAWFLRV